MAVHLPLIPTRNGCVTNRHGRDINGWIWMKCTFVTVGSVKPGVRNPLKCNVFPKIDLKSPLKVQKHYKKRVMRAVFALLTSKMSEKALENTGARTRLRVNLE